MPTSAKRTLPHETDARFLTDGGLETTLIFHEGWELPGFSSLPLASSEEGREAVRAYFDRYIPLAERAGAGFILESNTWRASPGWAVDIGVDLPGLERANRDAIALMHEVRARKETPRTPIIISGCIGPRGDGYVPGELMTAEEAEAYHAWQTGLFAEEDVDLVSALTMTNAPEAIGVARAAGAKGVPAVISFTVETDGRLPTGQTLGEAIAETDAACPTPPAYYMVNCAHPTHFAGALDPDAPWIARLRGLRANASKCSHAELDAMTELDDGDPLELGADYRALLDRLPHVNVLGGCCGTDHRHIAAIAEACVQPA